MSDRIHNKLDKIEEKLSQIDATLVRNTVSLEHHMLRTQQNEEMIALLHNDLKPIKTHVAHLQGVAKALTITSVLLGSIVALLKIIGKI